MTDWREKAKCRGVDTDIFYPILRDAEGVPILDTDGEEIDDYSEDATEEARSYCVQCPVIFDCLRKNLGEKDGIFADTNPDERAVLRRRSKK